MIEKKSFYFLRPSKAEFVLAGVLNLEFLAVRLEMNSSTKHANSDKINLTM